MMLKRFFIISSAILSCSCILMCISVSTSHWIDTKMNFKTNIILITKSYQGLFDICQDMILRGKFMSKCNRYSDLSQARPAYWLAVQILLILNILGSFITIFLSLMLALFVKFKSVLQLFLLSFFQVVPVCCGLVALAMFASKNVENVEKITNSKVLISASFGYSFITGWCAFILGLIALIASFIFTLLSYRSERLQLIARFEKLENQ